MSALATFPQHSELPFELDRFPADLRVELERAIAAVRVMEPLPPGHELISRLGEHELPAGAPRILGLHGAKRCGKTSLADFLEIHFAGVVQYGFSEPMVGEVNAYLAGSGHLIDDANKADPRYRYLVQMWAQARRFENPRYWIDPLIAGCRRELAAGARMVLLPGLREPLEWEAVSLLGGEVWKIVNPNLPALSAADKADQHPIERALAHVPDSDFDRTLLNDAENALAWCRLVRATVDAL